MVFSTLVELLGGLETYRIIAHSLFRLLASIMIAAVFGIFIGLLGGTFKTLNHLLMPLVAGLRSLPVASLIVIILILYAEHTAIYIISFLLLFPLIYEASRQGVLNLDTDIKQVVKLEPISLKTKLFFVYLPLAFPYIKSGLLQSIGLGFKVLVMAEFISQAQNSIGRMLNVGRINLEYDLVFAWTLIIIFLVMFLEIVVNSMKTNT